jgi:hypothetical protein
MAESTEEENTITETKSEQPWLEKQLEKLIGKQENMQPFIRALFSIAGFAAGVLVGNWLLGKEKDRKIEGLAREVIDLRDKNAVQEKELKSLLGQLEESKEKQMRLETEMKFIKEHSENSKEVNRVTPNRRLELSFLD